MQCFGMDGKRASKTALFDAVKRWDIAAVTAILSAAPGLVEASDTKGRRALHIACAVNPRRGSHGEPNGIKTVTALLKAGAGLESEVPMDEDGGRFPRDASLVRRCAWGKLALGPVSFESRRGPKLFALGGGVAR